METSICCQLFSTILSKVNNQKTMVTFEYKQITIFSKSETVLNEAGKHGWEAYGVIKEGDFYTIFLKRRKQSKYKNEDEA